MKKINICIIAALSTCLLIGCFSITSLAQSVPENTLTVRDGLPNFFTKVKEKKPVTVVYFGGSITNAGYGYRVQTEKRFREMYPGVPFTMINAAIGGTCSDLGAVRTEDDVLSHQPDLVFVEYAVNDDGIDSVKIIDAMEGIVRQILDRNSKTDICFLYTATDRMTATNLQGRHWYSARVMERVADYYKIPSIALDFALAKSVAAGKTIVKGEKGKDYGDKIIFSYDGVHPTREGHEIYTQALTDAFDIMSGMKQHVRKKPGKPLSPNNYEKYGWYSVTKAKMSGNWQQLGTGNEIYDRFKAELPELFCGTGADDQITVRFKGTRIGFFDVIGPGTGSVIVRIDNQSPIPIRRFDKYCTYYRYHYFWLPELEDGEHTVTLTVDPTPFDKQTDPPAAELSDDIRKDLPKRNIYLGKIMLSGNLLKSEK